MDVTLTAETGRPTGSRPSKRLRAAGKVPAVVYGLDQDPVSVVVQWTDVRRALNTAAGLNALITLEIDGHSDLTIIKDLQRDPVRRSVEHIDFLRIDRAANITVDVPIVLHGESKELEISRGIVEQLLHTLTISARPGSIPTQLDLDVSELELHQALRVSDLALPDGVTTEVDAEEQIAIGSPTRSTVAAEGEAGEGAEGGAPAGEAVQAE